MTFVLKQLVKQQTANDRLRHLRLQATPNNSNSSHNNNHFRLLQRSLCNRHSTVTSSILRRASQEVTQRPHNRRIHFSTRRDTTCVYPKGSALPLAVQKTFVFNGASKLRDLSRLAIMADHGMRRISQTYGNRHVGFDPAVEFTGRVTLKPLLEMPIGILQPILEEKGRKRRRSSSSDDTAGIDAALALPESKKICLRVEIASQVNRHGIKRRWDTTTTAEDDAAPEHKFKRARVCANESQVQSVEVSRFIVVPYFLFLCCVHFLHPNLIYILLIDPSLTIMSCRLSLLLRTFPSRQPTIPSSRMSSPRKHPLNSKEKKWRLRLREHSGVRWLLSSQPSVHIGHHAEVVGCASALITTCHHSENDQCVCLVIGSLLVESAEVGGSHFRSSFGNISVGGTYSYFTMFIW